MALADTKTTINNHNCYTKMRFVMSYLDLILGEQLSAKRKNSDQMKRHRQFTLQFSVMELSQVFPFLFFSFVFKFKHQRCVLLKTICSM